MHTNHASYDQRAPFQTHTARGPHRPAGYLYKNIIVAISRCCSSHKKANCFQDENQDDLCFCFPHFSIGIYLCCLRNLCKSTVYEIYYFNLNTDIRRRMPDLSYMQLSTLCMDWLYLFGNENLRIQSCWHFLFWKLSELECWAKRLVNIVAKRNNPFINTVIFLLHIYSGWEFKQQCIPALSISSCLYF